MVDWSEHFRYPPEYAEIVTENGQSFIRVQRDNKRAMRRYGTLADCGWYHWRSALDSTEALGPFRTLSAARRDAFEHEQ